MLSILVAPFYIALNLYVILRFFGWLESCHKIFKLKRFKISIAVAYTVFAFTLLIAFFMPPGSQLRRFVQLLSNYWLGIFLYTLLIVAVGHLLSLLLRRVFKVLPKDFFKNRKNHIISGAITLALITSVSAYGMIHAQNIQLKEYTVGIEKNMEKPLKVILVADWHLGYSIGKSHMQKMVKLINEQNPDLVCVAGDIYDNNYDAIENPEEIADILSGIQSTYGTYACWGNHDVDEKILGGFTFNYKSEKSHNPAMEGFFRRAKITLLEDELRLIDNRFYVAGRVDGEKPGTVGNQRKTPDELLTGADRTKPIFVIYHEPDEFAELADAGTDLLLCGHTHDGQLFPGNLTVKLAWENAYGYLKKGSMHNIVTSGIGVWGPFMRVGTNSEVVSITVNGAQ